MKTRKSGPSSRTILVLAALLTTAAGAARSQVYHCGNTYSQQACDGGRTVDVQDPRTASQKAQAEAGSRREAIAAQMLEATRLRQEAQSVPAHPAPHPPGSTADATADPLELSRKPYKAGKQPDMFVARAPLKPGEKKSKGRKKTKRKTA
jgi:hypothetical protein